MVASEVHGTPQSDPYTSCAGVVIASAAAKELGHVAAVSRYSRRSATLRSLAVSSLGLGTQPSRPSSASRPESAGSAAPQCATTNVIEG